MVRNLPLSDKRRTELISLDAHVAKVAENGHLLVFKVSSDSVHPRVFPGDLLLVDDIGHEEYPDSAMLLFQYDGKYLMRQKRFIRADLRRSKLRAVDGTTHSHQIRIIGRLIGWLSGPMD